MQTLQIRTQIHERFVPEPRLPVDPSKVRAVRFDDEDPHHLVRKLLELHYTHNDILTLRYYRGRWFHWNGTHYRYIQDDEIRPTINQQLRRALNGLASQKKVVRQKVENVTRALEGYCLVSGAAEMPLWLGNGPSPATGTMLGMKNGLLDVEAALSGKENPLHEPTPHWFSETYLPYEYAPEAKCPKWQAFLKEVLPGREERRMLQEFFGYCLTYDTSYHKALILVGEGANGKSVCTEVATQLLGDGNVSHVGLERFDDRFAMAPTIGRLANIVSEIPVVKGVAEDVLKAVVSGDLIRIEFKYHNPTDARPTARLIFATNELPHFLDRSEGLWRRLLIIPFEVTIPEEQQDRKLAQNICGNELPGLLNWALHGLRRLREQDMFTVPDSSRELVEEHRVASNPAREYLEEWCEVVPDEQTPCDQLYTQYLLWCSGPRNTQPLNRQQFGREVHRLFPQVQRKQLRTGKTGKRHYVYVGLLNKRTPSRRP